MCASRGDGQVKSKGGIQFNLGLRRSTVILLLISERSKLFEEDGMKVASRLCSGPTSSSVPNGGLKTNSPAIDESTNSAFSCAAVRMVPYSILAQAFHRSDGNTFSIIKTSEARAGRKFTLSEGSKVRESACSPASSSVPSGGV